jgi:hypothetical protein
MKKFLLATAMALATFAANGAEHRIECVGTVTFWPVHDFRDPELRNGVASLEAKDQRDDCSTRFTGRHLTKVMKTCRQDELCKVSGVIGHKGWVRIDHVER